MHYKGIDLDDNNRVIQCPVCKNTEFSDDVDYCRICGTKLFNRCEGTWNEFDNYLMTHDNPGNARFCETCGKPTSFLKENILEPWHKAETVADSANEDPFDEW